MNILIIAPHADDEVLGCGGTIHRYCEAGHDVFILIATNGYVGAPELYSKERVEEVRSEALEAHGLLGVKKTYFLDFPAIRLETIPIYKIASKISELIKIIKPMELYIPHFGDIHNDHKIISNAALIAARPINNCPVKKILSYETLSETEWALPLSGEAFVPNVFKGIEDNIKYKTKAMSQFQTQVRKFPHPRSIESIKALASYRGSTVGLCAAEAFLLIREIN